jgi:DNA repair protein RadA/Sms
VVVDSVQTLHGAESGLPAGGIPAIKHVCGALSAWTRAFDAITVLVAHVTKEGAIAGPRAVEHLVDVVMYLEAVGHDLRLVRATKNRFGPADEIGLLEMTAAGLVDLTDAGSRFLIDRDGPPPPGVAVAPVFEGSRVLLVELQSLVAPAKASLPRVYADGADLARVARLAAVLERHAGAHFGSHDIYVNVAGGIRLRDVAADLPLALSMFSALTQRSLPAKAAAFGEVSLAGEIHPVAAADRRIRALSQLGFGPIAVPNRGARELTSPAAAEPIGTLRAAVGRFFPESRP